MGVRADIMQARARQALRGKMAVNLRQPHHPGRSAARLRLELRMALLQPRDVRPQRLDQGRGMIALTERCDRGASFPAPRTMM